MSLIAILTTVRHICKQRTIQTYIFNPRTADFDGDGEYLLVTTDDGD